MSVAVECKRDPDVNVTLGELSAVASDLDSAVGRLTAVLEPVLRHESDEAGPPQSTPTRYCPLSANVADNTITLRSVGVKLADILNRLEL